MCSTYALEPERRPAARPSTTRPPRQLGVGRARARRPAQRRRRAGRRARAASPPTGTLLQDLLGQSSDPQRGPPARAEPRGAARARPRSGSSPALDPPSRRSTTCWGVTAGEPARGQAALTASPVLVGAVTVLVTIVAVFLSYNANSGLPFVPTYDLKANLPNAAQLVKGFEVRIGGARVGFISKIEPKKQRGRHRLRAGDDEARQGDRAAAGRLDAARAPALVARPEVHRARRPGSGQARARRPAPRSRCARRARPVVELDDLFNMFDAKARVGQRQLARRLRRRLRGPRPGHQHGDRGIRAAARPTSSRSPRTCPTRTRGSTASSRRSRARPQEVAPVAEEQASLFVNLDTSFTALGVGRAAVPPGDDLGEPAERAARDRAVPAPAAVHPQQRRLLPRAAARRGGAAARAPRSSPTPSRRAREVLPKTKQMNERPGRRVRDARRVRGRPDACAPGVNQLTRLVLARCSPRSRFLTPAQTTCNYATLFLRNVASLLSEGDSNGNYQRFLDRLGAHATRSPSSSGRTTRAARRPRRPTARGRHNHLHVNPYPNTAAPGQTQECEAGNERYAAGQTVIGNTPGNQGTKTERAAMRRGPGSRLHARTRPA